MREVNFKLEIGQEIKDNKRDLVIIYREIRPRYTKEGKFKCNDKWYKYHCNKCGNEDWIIEYSLLKNRGCNVCAGKKVLQGYNDIYTTDYWMVELGVSVEDAKKYTHSSKQKIIVTCPICGSCKEKCIGDIYRTKSIGCSCGDGISFSEKFIVNMLNQLNINYIKEYYPDWIKNKRYDFYFELNNKKYIIEAHGEQHYNYGFDSCGGRSVEEERENDKYKKEVALSNGIDYYIELNCSKSNIKNLTEVILNSELNAIFDLSNVDWLKCEKFASKNIVKEVCDYWKEHNEINREGLTTTDLSKIFKLGRQAIRLYLKQGAKLGWCNYNSEEEQLKGRKISSGFNKSKKIEIFKEGKSLGVFSSISELSRRSESLLGIKLLCSCITQYMKENWKQYKGFTFRYVEN